MPVNLVQWGRYLFHITHRENLPTVLAKGLYSKNEAQRLNLKFRSIADEGIQARRSATAVPVGKGGTIHDYVPLFFGARPPMLYAVKFKFSQEDIVTLLVNWSVLDLATTVFTDGNAATGGTNFLHGKGELGRVDREAAGAVRWSEPSDLRRKKAAEVLVWKCVPVDCIARLAVMNETSKGAVDAVVGRMKPGLTVDVIPEFYYR